MHHVLSFQELKDDSELAKLIVATRHKKGRIVTAKEFGIGEWSVYKAQYVCGEDIPVSVKAQFDKQLKESNKMALTCPLCVTDLGHNYGQGSRHIRRNHPEMPYHKGTGGHDFVCDICNTTCYKLAGFVAHWTASHGLGKKEKREIDRAFDECHQEKGSNTVPHSKRTTCDICGVFVGEDKFAHFQREHPQYSLGRIQRPSGGTQFRCLVCGSKLASLGSAIKNHNHITESNLPVKSLTKVGGEMDNLSDCSNESELTSEQILQTLKTMIDNYLGRKESLDKLNQENVDLKAKVECLETKRHELQVALEEAQVKNAKLLEMQTQPWKVKITKDMLDTHHSATSPL